MELVLKMEYIYTGEVIVRFKITKRLPFTANVLMVCEFCYEMELHSGNERTFGDLENNLNAFKTFQNESMWSIPKRENRGNNHCETIPKTTRFDFNNNDNTYLPTIQQQMSRVVSVLNRDNFQLKNQPSFNNNVFGGHYIQLDAQGPYISTSNNNAEQVEPMDLSCAKNKDVQTSDRIHHETKHTSYFEPNSEMSLSMPSNINEATLLILKSVYDVKYHRKPNCDKIFHEDPVNPKLYVCKVCTKHVRSKWHHFQTHYSRDHKCSDCDAVYSRIDTLRTHAKKRHHTVIPRYYYGIPANVWHRVIVQYPDPLTAPRPSAAAVSLSPPSPAGG